VRIIRKAEEMFNFSYEQAELYGQIVGLVPTMGYFHEGHLSLMRASKQQDNITIVSIYVNPTQFAPHEDFKKYPRDFERDCEMAEKEGVDVIFAPSDEEMYPAGYSTYVEVEGLSGVLCGKSRPTHFRGVATVCLKLFQICYPKEVYFGLKDYQQSVIIRRMVKDLNLPVHVNVLPIVREPDGLAMSSRNVYLSPEERKQAVVLFNALKKVEKRFADGEREASVLKTLAEEEIRTAPSARIDYVELVHPESLQAVERIDEGGAVLALAVFIGTTRLIDNTLLGVKGRGFLEE